MSVQIAGQVHCPFCDEAIDVTIRTRMLPHVLGADTATVRLSVLVPDHDCMVGPPEDGEPGP